MTDWQLFLAGFAAGMWVLLVVLTAVCLWFEEVDWEDE